MLLEEGVGGLGVDLARLEIGGGRDVVVVVLVVVPNMKSEMDFVILAAVAAVVAPAEWGEDG